MERGSPQVGPARFDGVRPVFFGAQVPVCSVRTRRRSEETHAWPRARHPVFATPRVGGGL